MLDISSHRPYLGLPGYRNAARVEASVERVIRGVQVDTFDRRELLNVKDVFTVDGARRYVNSTSVLTPRGTRIRVYVLKFMRKVHRHAIEDNTKHV